MPEPSPFGKLQVTPAYRMLAERISDLILDGTLKPGAALPTELTLCEQFGVHRSTVREGIRLLEDTGLLQRVNQKRLVVSRPTKEQVSSQVARGLLLHDVSFFELWETAMVIEPHTAGLAAIHMLDEDLRALEDNLRATEAALADPQVLTQLDIEFHALLVRGVHNRVWQFTREPMARMFYPAFEAVMTQVPEAGARLLKAHRSVFDALQKGDAEAASGWMEKHIRDFKRGFQRAGLDIHGPALRPARSRGGVDP